MRNATVKFFDTTKGWGFLTDSATGENIFCHYLQLQMDGFKSLHEDDLVEYELGECEGNDERQQAVNIQPILTRKMTENSLKEENQHVKTIKDAHKVTKYLVLDENNVIQTSEQGMTFSELAAYANFEIVQLSA